MCQITWKQTAFTEMYFHALIPPTLADFSKTAGKSNYLQSSSSREIASTKNSSHLAGNVNIGLYDLRPGEISTQQSNERHQ